MKKTVYIIAIHAMVTQSVIAVVIFDFENDLQGWVRFNDSVLLSHENHCLMVRYQEPSGQWYPIIERPSLNFAAEGHEEISISVTAYKVPVEGMQCRFVYYNSLGYGLGLFRIYPGQQIVRFNAAQIHSEGQPYSGTINKIRFDMPQKTTLDYLALSNSELRIDWIAVSSNSQFTAADETGQFILFNFSTTGAPLNQALFDDLKSKLPNRPNARLKAGANRMIRLMENADASSALSGLQTYLSLAQQNNIPVTVQIDIENYWTNRQDLWNWWDPSLPGYNPNNRNNVEWYGWGPQYATKIAWRNWGSLHRVKPAPNLMSPAYRAEVHRLYELAVPIIVQWWNNLPVTQKDIFVGLKVGWESSIGVNAFYYPNGNYYYETWPTTSENDPSYSVNGTIPPAYGVQQIGYAALTSSGLKTSGSITEYDLAQITGMHLSDLAQKAYSLGLPRDKIFTHSWHFKNSGTNTSAAVNPYSNPGWSYYTNNNSGVLNIDADIASAVNNSDACFWALSETLFQGTNTTSAWQTFFDNNLDPRCKFISIFNWDNISTSELRLNAVRNLQNASVPPSSFSLQTAIDNAVDGDTIIVPRGVHYANVSVVNKTLTISGSSADDWDAVFDTVIDAEGKAGAIAVQNSAKTFTLRGVTIRNGSSINGGAVSGVGGNLIIENCRIFDNAARDFGGGLYIQNANATVQNCMLYGNRAVYGGAIFARNSTLDVINATITHNQTTNKGTGIWAYENSVVDLRNTIVWYNESVSLRPVAIRDSVAKIDFCNLQNGKNGVLLEGTASLHWGPGNLNMPPAFADSEARDYHLLSSAGRAVNFGTGYLMDASTSPMIDKGRPGDSPGNEPAGEHNKRINIGAYGGTSSASLTPAGFGLLADIDNDGTVKFGDFAIAAGMWLSANEESRCADFNRNGGIDIYDINEMAAEWLLVSGNN